MNVILLRHGQSLWNLENRFTGWYDIDLTPAGETEASLAGCALACWIQTSGSRIEVVFTSTLTRALRTAEITLNVMEERGIDLGYLRSRGKQPWQAHAALNERNYGDLSGLNKAEVTEIHGIEQVQRWRRAYAERPPGGESLADVVKRIRPWAETYLRVNKDANDYALIVAHGNSLRALLVIMGLYKETEIARIEIPTGRPFLISFDKAGDPCPWIELMTTQPDIEIAPSLPR